MDCILMYFVIDQWRKHFVTRITFVFFFWFMKCSDMFSHETWFHKDFVTHATFIIISIASIMNYKVHKNKIFRLKQGKKWQKYETYQDLHVAPRNMMLKLICCNCYIYIWIHSCDRHLLGYAALRFLLWKKTLLQVSHLYSFRSSWTLTTCNLSVRPSVNNSLQNEHLMGEKQNIFNWDVLVV